MTNQLPPTLNELFGTKSKKEQAKRAQSLIGQINAPVVDLIIRFDGRTNQLNISLIGPDLKIEDLYKILDGARDMLRERELQAINAKESQEQSDIPTEENSERTENNG